MKNLKVGEYVTLTKEALEQDIYPAGRGKIGVIVRKGHKWNRIVKWPNVFYVQSIHSHWLQRASKKP